MATQRKVLIQRGNLPIEGMLLKVENVEKWLVCLGDEELVLIGIEMNQVKREV